MAVDTFTRPERAQAVAEAKRIREQVRIDGGCLHCTRRDQTFAALGSRATCGLSPPRTFPACINRPGGFEFDDQGTGQ